MEWTSIGTFFLNLKLVIKKIYKFSSLRGKTLNYRNDFAGLFKAYNESINE